MYVLSRIFLADVDALQMPNKGLEKSFVGKIF